MSKSLTRPEITCRNAQVVPGYEVLDKMPCMIAKDGKNIAHTLWVEMMAVTEKPRTLNERVDGLKVILRKITHVKRRLSDNGFIDIDSTIAASDFSFKDQSKIKNIDGDEFSNGELNKVKNFVNNFVSLAETDIASVLNFIEESKLAHEEAEKAELARKEAAEKLFGEVQKRRIGIGDLVD